MGVRALCTELGPDPSHSWSYGHEAYQGSRSMGAVRADSHSPPNDEYRITWRMRITRMAPSFSGQPRHEQQRYG